MKHKVKGMLVGSYLLILVLGMVIYLGVRLETEKRLRDVYIERQLTVMQQAVTVVDGELETIKRFGLKLARDPYVQLFTYVDEPLERGDLENTVNLVRNIRAQYIDQSWIEDFYIYYQRSDRVADSSSFYPADNYYQLEWSWPGQSVNQWKHVLLSQEKSDFLPVTRMTNGGKQGDYIPSLYHFGSLQDDNGAVVVVLLKKAWLEEALKGLSEGGRTVIRMGGQADALVSFSESEELAEPSPAELHWSSGDGSWKQVEWEGNTYLATRLLSEQSGWQYESMIPYKRITEQMKASTTPLFAGLFLYAVIGIPACLFLALKSYKPIENINRKYRQLAAEHDGTVKEWSIAAEKLKKNRERLQESMMQQLISGRWQDERELEERFQGLNIAFPYEKYCVAIMRIDNHAEPGKRWENQEKALTAFILKNVTREFLEPAGQIYLVSGESDNISILLNLTDSACEGRRISAAAESLLEQLKDYLINVMQIPVSIGIGQVCDRRRELSQSYQNARAALDYCFIAGKSSVIIYNDLENTEKHKPYNPDKKIEKMLLHAVVQKDRTACEQILNDYFRDAFNKRLSVAEGRQLHIYLTDLMLKLIARSGLPGKMAEFCQDQVSSMLSCESLPDMILLMKKLMTCLCEERTCGESGLGVEAVQFIKNNYQNCSLSLQLCADVFQVTPEHLSRTIKMETAKTFMEIVNDLRIEEAKYHLLQSDKKMEEIAALSGFGTTKSFFRSFKQAEGVPPGVWRKLHQ